MKLEYYGIDLFSADMWLPWSQRFSLIFLHMRELRESHEAVNTSHDSSSPLCKKKKKYQQKVSGTRVMCGAYQRESDILLRSQGFWRDFVQRVGPT